MIYKEIKWWPDAYHVFDGDKRLGIVNRRTVRINGKVDRIVWFAHNHHFFSVKGEFPNRTAAAEAIPRGVIHQSSDALAPHGAF